MNKMPTLIGRLDIPGQLPVEKYKTIEDLNESSVEEWATVFGQACAEDIPSSFYKQLMILIKEENEITKDNEYYKQPLCKVITDRIKKTPLHFRLSPAATIALAIIAQTVRNSVMYLAFIEAKNRKLNKKITAMELVTDILNNCRVSDENLIALWENQKVLIQERFCENILDYSECYASLVITRIM